jgi:hypothetical protein
MSDTTDYVPFPPPAPCGDTHISTITPKQEEALKEVFEHFSAADYGLPGEQSPELMEEEKFWLVSLAFPPRTEILILRLYHRQSHECMLR